MLMYQRVAATGKTRKGILYRFKAAAPAARVASSMEIHRQSI
ncbi:MAG TPA: hypothetical protein PK773_05725 [Aminivibrio sp.]|nr:hypothetical protein [Aminivibrio sp.]